MSWYHCDVGVPQAVLMQSREQVAEELSRLQRDNDSLKGKHRLHSELQQEEGFLMPGTVQVRPPPQLTGRGAQ